MCDKFTNETSQDDATDIIFPSFSYFNQISKIFISYIINYIKYVPYFNVHNKIYYKLNL